MYNRYAVINTLNFISKHLDRKNALASNRLGLENQCV